MQKKHTAAVIIIDVFRAFTTSCYILSRTPSCYILTNKSKTILKLLTIYPNTLLIGKPENDNINLNYDIPNSPTRTLEVETYQKTVLHRTEAGAKGVLQALRETSGIVLAASFVNADATVDYLKKLNISDIKILPMGHEAITPSLEDDLCAEYIQSCLRGKVMDLTPFLPVIRQSAGRYFFTEDQWQYPQEDFIRCLHLKQFNFAIQAKAEEDYAVLERHDINCVTT